MPADYADRGSFEHPPGFYGPPDGGISVNALKPDDRLLPLDFAPLGQVGQGSLAGARTVDLRPGLFTRRCCSSSSIPSRDFGSAGSSAASVGCGVSAASPRR